MACVCAPELLTVGEASHHGEGQRSQRGPSREEEQLTGCVTESPEKWVLPAPVESSDNCGSG